MPANISSNQTIREYAQGAARQNVRPAADIIAPTVGVPSATGRYKKWNTESAFKLPDTRRASGSEGVILDFTSTDPSYTCEPHAINVPVDMVGESQEDAEYAFMEAADIAAGIAGLSHEKTVIDLALANATNQAVTWDSSATPISDIDTAILLALKGAKMGSGAVINVLFGANAWRGFKNQANVKNAFVIGTSAKAGVSLAVPTETTAGSLFIGNPNVQTSLMVYDGAQEGADASMNFVLDDNVLIWIAAANPNRMDSSFMKTFRLRNRYMVPRDWDSASKRVRYAGFDWSEDVQITNAAAGRKLTVSYS